jgi:hypothetical protein
VFDSTVSRGVASTNLPLDKLLRLTQAATQAVAAVSASVLQPEMSATSAAGLRANRLPVHAIANMKQF